MTGINRCSREFGSVQAARWHKAGGGTPQRPQGSLFGPRLKIGPPPPPPAPCAPQPTLAEKLNMATAILSMMNGTLPDAPQAVQQPDKPAVEGEVTTKTKTMSEDVAIRKEPADVKTWESGKANMAVMEHVNLADISETPTTFPVTTTLNSGETVTIDTQEALDALKIGNYDAINAQSNPAENMKAWCDTNNMTSSDGTKITDQDKKNAVMLAATKKMAIAQGVPKDVANNWTSLSEAKNCYNGASKIYVPSEPIEVEHDGVKYSIPLNGKGDGSDLTAAYSVYVRSGDDSKIINPTALKDPTLVTWYDYDGSYSIGDRSETLTFSVKDGECGAAINSELAEFLKANPKASDEEIAVKIDDIMSRYKNT